MKSSHQTTYIPEQMLKQIAKPRGKIDLEALLKVEKQHFTFEITECLAGYSIFAPQEAKLMHMKELICEFDTQEYHEKSQKLSRALGSMMSLAIGDGFGHLFEFLPFQSKLGELKALTESDFFEAMQSTHNSNQFRIKPGQWTDDTSMSLCLADCLLMNGMVDCVDLRKRFTMWNSYGYNNGFRFDETRDKLGGKSSIGLGGNISMSLMEFRMSGFKSEATSAGNKYTSGNGSIMRLAPLPIFYHDSQLSLMASQAEKQSKTTHQGLESSDCSKILSFVVANAIQQGEELEVMLLEEDKEESVAKKFLDSLDFSKVVSFLETEGAKHMALSQCVDFDTWIQDGFNKLKNDKNWDWKEPNGDTFSPTRLKQNSGYFGSYAMDGLKIALHCVYNTRSYEECMLKIINWKGDSDTTGAIAGQMAGAIYGISRIPKDAKELVLKWDNSGEIALRAYKLFYKKLL